MRETHEQDSTDDLIRLAMIDGIGPRTRQKLLQCFGSPTAVLGASAAELQRVPGVGNALSRRILAQGPALDVASIRETCAAHQIEILVTDNGRGMSKAAQQRVFDPGFSTKASGWGMGLALVRRIVEEYHRGRVEVARSVEGEGTTFRVRIPAV